MSADKPFNSVTNDFEYKAFLLNFDTEPDKNLIYNFFSNFCRLLNGFECCVSLYYFNKALEEKYPGVNFSPRNCSEHHYKDSFFSNVCLNVRDGFKDCDKVINFFKNNSEALDFFIDHMKHTSNAHYNIESFSFVKKILPEDSDKFKRAENYYLICSDKFIAAVKN